MNVKHVAKWASMWSLVLTYTGRDSKKVFVILKESSIFASPR